MHDTRRSKGMSIWYSSSVSKIAILGAWTGILNRKQRVLPFCRSVSFKAYDTYPRNRVVLR